MSNVQITVSRWSPGDDEPEIVTYELTADGTWNNSQSQPGSPACTLDDIMFVDPHGAIHVETSGTIPASILAAALPQSPECLGHSEQIETDDDVLDQYLGTEVRQVAIDGQLWAAFPVASDQPDILTWFECDPEELGRDFQVPSGRQIAYASGCDPEWGGGIASWDLRDLGDYVCFVAMNPDFEDKFLIEERRGRTHRELAEKFCVWVDWDPVRDAVTRAIELGGRFEGVISLDGDDELDGDDCDGPEVRAYVDLSETV